LSITYQSFDFTQCRKFPSLGNNPTLNSRLQERAKKEIQMFCSKTVRQLAILEKSRQTEPLSIEDLVHVDISLVRRREDEKLHYYVNEITRCPTMAMGLAKVQDFNKAKKLALIVESSLKKTYKHHMIKYPWLYNSNN
jgi:hypothetical protein